MSPESSSVCGANHEEVKERKANPAMTCPSYILTSSHEQFFCERIRLHEGMCWHQVERRLLIWGVFPKGLR